MTLEKWGHDQSNRVIDPDLKDHESWRLQVPTS